MRQRISIVVCMSMACMFSSNALDKIANLDVERKTNSVQDSDNDKTKDGATKNVNNKTEQKSDNKQELKPNSSQEKTDEKEKKMQEQEQKEKENVISNNQAVSDEHVQQDDDSGDSNMKVEITPVLVVEDEEVEQKKEQSPSSQNTADVTNKTSSGKVEKKIITKDGTNTASTDNGVLHKAKDSVMNATEGVMNFAQQKCGKMSASLEHAKNTTKDMTGWAKFSNFVKAWWEHFQK